MTPEETKKLFDEKKAEKAAELWKKGDAIKKAGAQRSASNQHVTDIIVPALERHRAAIGSEMMIKSYQPEGDFTYVDFTLFRWPFRILPLCRR